MHRTARCVDNDRFRDLLDLQLLADLVDDLDVR